MHASANIQLRGRILLVEDGCDNQRLLQAILSDAGATVVGAENGQIAVDLATTQQFDAILMDMQMPVMDGHAATVELRRMGLTIPIIALTAFAMAEDREKCKASGCTACLRKPVEEEILLKTVNELMGNDHSFMVNEGAGAGVVGSPLERDAGGPIKSSLADHPRVMEILPEFVRRLPGEVRKMTDFLQHNDLPALQRVVHQLLGAGGGYGFNIVSETATRAEKSIREGKDMESITADIKLLIEIIRRIDGYDESIALIAAEKGSK